MTAKLAIQATSILQLFILFACTLSSTKAENKELAELYQSVLFDYNVFPPVYPDPQTFKGENASSILPVEVVIGTALVSVDEILPGDSEYTVTLRSLIYYKNSLCNQTEIHQAACSTRLMNGSGKKFVRNTRVKEMINIQYASVENAHQQAFIDRGKTEEQPNLEIASYQATLQQTFDMKYYPFEYHELEFSVVSAFSKNIVSLTKSQVDAGALDPPVPQGWTFHGISCEVTNTFDETALSPDSGFDKYSCVIKVSKKNPSWWLTSFFLTAGLCLLAVAGSLGIMSHEIAEARDDKDLVRQAVFSGSRQMATFTVGLLLTYVFKVEVSPYNRPIEYWPSIPASSQIYILGMAYLLIQAIVSHIASLRFPINLTRNGFVGRVFMAYKIEELPIEGKDKEYVQPLLLKRYRPEKGSGGVEDEQDDAATGITKQRLNRDKYYDVMSVEEAVRVNKYVKHIFLLKTSMIAVVLIASCIILGNASAQYHNLIDEASAI